MIETYKYEFWAKNFRSVICRLNRSTPFFVSFHTLRNAMEKFVTELMKEEINKEIKRAIEDKLAYCSVLIANDGCTIEPDLKLDAYPTISDKTKIRISNAQWDTILDIAYSYGFRKDSWQGEIILAVPSLEISQQYTFLRSYTKYQELFNKLMFENGWISFYGGELFTKEQEKGDKFLYTTFSVSSYQLDDDSYIYANSKFKITQLKYIAEQFGKKVSRVIKSDALATVEILEIS